jgi:hypothetical protein
MIAAADYWIKQALLLTCTPPMVPGKNFRELGLASSCKQEQVFVGGKLKALFKESKHLLIAPSTQMLSAVQNPVLRCLMGDMLNGRAPVYCDIANCEIIMFLGVSN